MKLRAMCGLVAALLGAAGAGAQPAGKPGASPGAACTGERGRVFNLCGLEFNARTRMDRVVAQLGPPTMLGPARDIHAYRMAPEDWLWLSYSETEPRRITRAILARGAFVPQTTIIHNDLGATRARRRDQLDLTRPLSAAEVGAAWGPPDNVIGSGFEIWLYALADGSVANLVFESGLLARVDGRPIAGPALSVDSLRQDLARPGEIIFMGTTPQSTHAAPAGTYIMALFADTSDAVQDYIWYHHSRDGSWFTRGGRFVTNLDSAGSLLLDPRAAGRNYGPAAGDALNYDQFVGYFAVRPGAIPVQRPD